MFELPTLQLSVKARTGLGQWAGEAIATFGLILTILGTVRHRPQWVPASVALYITAAYWFTSSTSFANPAITVARSLSNSFAGIAPADVPRSSSPSSRAPPPEPRRRPAVSGPRAAGRDGQFCPLTASAAAMSDRRQTRRHPSAKNAASGSSLRPPGRGGDTC